ncbi:hypothetical protein AB4Y95_00060 [Arthrobacter sp. M-10]|uniref:hypothetical protein n=1 Tax=Arthrobacter sp. M-10 TaxID=3233037 RepID=UPI003F91457E
MQSQMMASVEDVETALMAVRSGNGLTALSLAEQPTLMRILKARSAVDGVEIFHKIASDIEDTPQVIAAKFGFGLPHFAPATPRYHRIAMGKKALGISERSFYRWEGIGIRSFAHVLIDRSSDNIEDHSRFRRGDHSIDDNVTLESVYEMVISLTESHQSIKEDVLAIRGSLLNIERSQRRLPKPNVVPSAFGGAQTELGQLITQVESLSKAVGVIHKAVTGEVED